MRVLCAIGRREGAARVRETLALLGTGVELVVVQVIDTGPRRDLEHIAGPLRRGLGSSPLRGEAMTAAEEEAARVDLGEAEEEAKRLGCSVTSRIERGEPGHTLVRVAREVAADIVATGSREQPEAHPLQGPPSVGHTARFVVDHAPCPVLLLRTRITV